MNPHTFNYWYNLLLAPAIAAGIVLVAGRLIQAGLNFIFRNWLKRTRLATFSENLPRRFFPSSYIVIYSVLTTIALNFITIPEVWDNRLSHWVTISFIVGAVWLAINATHLFQDIAFYRYRISEPDNLVQRRIRTQLAFVVRLTIMLLLLFGLAAVLFTFPGARRVGTSLIASAGLASIIIGFAAQKSLANLVAGFQIAFTQPIRIDDVVIVENEWGVIEEITLTYVVVRIWDLRRLVVPITYFVEKPFQNWTRTSAELIGSVFLRTDYRVDVPALRTHLEKFLQSEPLWDKKNCVLQVTESYDSSIELRALVSSSTSPKLWDLRCIVREEMINYLQKHHPDSLPRNRTEGTLEITASEKALGPVRPVTQIK